MNHPGVRVLDDLSTNDRGNGMGIVVEYAGARGRPQRVQPPAFKRPYTRFARRGRRQCPITSSI